MGPVVPHRRGVTSILIEAGVVTLEQVEAGVIRQRSTGLRIGETLVEMNCATEEDIGWALARQLGIAFVDLPLDTLDHELIRSFPDGLLHRLEAVPLLSESAALSVALADPTDTSIVNQLERLAGRSITPAIATPSTIRRALREILGPRRDAGPASAVRVPGSKSDATWDRSGASFLLFHLAEARGRGATEIHFQSRQSALEVRYRVGEHLVRVADEPAAAIYSLLSRIEALGGPVTDEHRVHVGLWPSSIEPRRSSSPM